VDGTAGAVKRLSVRLLLTDEQAVRACLVSESVLTVGALTSAGIIDLDPGRVCVDRVEDVPGRLGVEMTDPAGTAETAWFDDEAAQKRAALDALKRFERVRYVREVASAFDWPAQPRPAADAAVLEWARNIAQEIHAGHTSYDRKKGAYAREIAACPVEECVEACRVLGIEDTL
jgi:hypothetical protein